MCLLKWILHRCLFKGSTECDITKGDTGRFWHFQALAVHCVLWLESTGNTCDQSTFHFPRVAQRRGIVDKLCGLLENSEAGHNMWSDGHGICPQRWRCWKMGASNSWRNVSNGLFSWDKCPPLGIEQSGRGGKGGWRGWKNGTDSDKNFRPMSTEMTNWGIRRPQTRPKNLCSLARRHRELLLIVLEI